MAPASAERQWKPRVNPWVIAATVALAAFMEVLDTSVANVALPHIAGNLGASTDEGTWVLTSYLVSNAIVLPMGAWASEPGSWGPHAAVRLADDVGGWHDPEGRKGDTVAAPRAA
ncbi:MAG TPA: hypothetical protein VN911_17970 [Candidatus Acidoferrum sp.]|nr:hypothetical protein [Candidatus Acidoferrum sp.]